MKKLIIICLVFLLCASAYGTPVGRSNLATAVADVQTDTTALIQLAADQLGQINNAGNVFYVDSNASGSGTGVSWTNAVTTIKAGALKCASDNGDVLLVAPGHAETLVASDAVDITRTGLRIFGLGVGENRPTLTYTANGEFVIGADDVEIHGFNFIAGNAVVHAIDVEAGFENFVINNCRFTVTVADTDEFIDCIDIAAGSDNGKITNCRAEMGAASAVSFISHVGSDYTEIFDNIVSGDFSTACIEDATTASIWMFIRNNILINGTVGGTAGLNTVATISLKADTSAIIVKNVLFCNVASSELAIVAADGLLSGNTYGEAEGITGSMIMDKGPGIRHITVATTSSMTIGNGYDQDDDPAIFTVTGDILCRAGATFTTQITSTSTDTLNLGVVGAETALLVQDVADGTAFDVGDTWTLQTAADADGGIMADDWIVVSGGDIKLYIDDHGLTAGVTNFYLEWIGVSGNASVADVAP